MDSGPFRMGDSGTSGRHAANRPVAANRPEPAEEEQYVEERPKAVHRSNSRHVEPKKSKKPFIIGAIIAAVVLVAFVIIGYMILLGGNKTASGIDSSKYQAVFFTNGQVYFGKLANFNEDHMKLTDVFYLQTKEATQEADSENPQKTSSETNGGVELIKLGNEIHGPTDEMIISKDQVLFYENLKSDGKVAASIDQYKKSTNK